MAPGRAKGLEENRAGPSGGGGGEVFSNIEVRVKRAGPSRLGNLEVTEYAHTQRAVRERGRRTCPPGNDRIKIHA